MKTDRLEEIRRDLGLSKAQMADLMGIEASYYSHILKGEGKGNLRLEHLERLLNDANVNPLWLNPQAFQRPDRSMCRCGNVTM